MSSSAASSVGVGARPEPLRQLGGRRAEPQVQLLEPARHLDRPAVVAEVPADLAHDRRHRERHEVRAGVDVEPDHGVHQADAGDLHEVVARLTAAVEATRDVVGQRQAALDDAVTLTLNFAEPSGSSCSSRNMSGDIRVFRVRPR